MTAQFEIIIQFATLATIVTGVIFSILKIDRARKAHGKGRDRRFQRYCPRSSK